MERATKFDAVDVAVELVEALVEILPKLSADLRDQVQRAANSVVLKATDEELLRPCAASSGSCLPT